MNCKVDIPDSTALSYNLRSPAYPFPAFSSGSIGEQEFIDLYYSRIYSAILRLLRLTDAAELETLTATSIPLFKKQGNKERIQLPRDGLPIHSASYLHIIAPVRGILHSYQLKIKKLWKIF